MLQQKLLLSILKNECSDIVKTLFKEYNVLQTIKIK